MRAGVIVLALAIATPGLGAQGPGPQEPAPVLTLRAAVDMARRNSARMLDAEARIEESQHAQRLADAAFRPSIVPRMSGAIGGGDLANQTFGAEFSQRFRWGTELQASVASTSSRNQLGTFYYSDTTLALTQPLHRGGVDTRRRDSESAARDVETARRGRVVTERAVAVDVAAAYFAIVAQEQVLQVAETAVKRHRHLLAVSEAKLEIGKVSQLDVLRARRLVREAEGQLEDARAVAEDARDQLRSLLGSRDLEAFAVTRDIPTGKDDLPVESAVRLARDVSVTVQNARVAVAAAERDVRDARRPLLPRVDFTLALTRREIGSTLRSSLGTDRFRLLPMLQISLPTGRGLWDEDEARRALELARRQRELRAAELKADLDVRRAVRHRDRLHNQLRNAEADVASATEQVDVARERFERGLSNNLELVAAEADLLSAESRRISAAAALAVAALQLKALAGTLDLEKDFGR